MIRVVHVISGLEFGGAEIMLANLVSCGNSAQFQHTVVSLTTAGDVGSHIEAADIKVVALGMKRHRSNVAPLLRLMAILRRQKPDIVQTWLYHGDLAGTFAALCVGSRRIAWNIQCSALSETSLGFRAIIKLLALSSRLVSVAIVNSESGYEAHRRLGYRPPAWVRIPNGVDTDAFRPSTTERPSARSVLGVPQDGFAIGLVARFHPMKDHATFLAAAARFAARRRDAIFVLVGAADEAGLDALRVLVVEAGLSDRALFLGPRTDLAQVYRALDVLTLSSAYGEGCPNVLLEAMACGIPCVATNVGDCAAIVGDTGRIVAPRDPQALCDAWTEMARADRVRLGDAARARVVRNFALERIVASYEEAYRGLVHGGILLTAATTTVAETQ